MRNLVLLVGGFFFNNEFGHVRLAPDAHGVDDGLEAAAAIGERIFDARRHFGEHFTLEQAVLFHGAQI